MSMRHLMAIVAFVSLLGFVGCSGATDNTSSVTEASGEEHTHGEWWCDEHGVPEEICAQCSTRTWC